MKNLLFVSLIFLSSILVAQNNTTDKKPVKKTGKTAEITFEETVYDFGKIKYKGNGTHSFVYKNTGKKPLILTKVRSSCGCTVPKWSKEPTKKRDKNEIKVKYNTGRVGKFTKSITVYSNAKNSTVKLVIKGEVLKKEPEPETSPIKE